MVPLHVLTLIVVGANQPSILVLEPLEELHEGKSRIVPIWIWANEAVHLGMAIDQGNMPRPMTHDLLLDALTCLDACVDHVIITDVKGLTFFAQLILHQGDRLIALDARPTDAISLAIRQSAPFYINEDVLDRASFPYLFKQDKEAEVELEEFRTFIDQITPDDFRE